MFGLILAVARGVSPSSNPLRLQIGAAGIALGVAAAATSLLTFIVQPQVAANLSAHPWGVLFPALAVGGWAAALWLLARGGEMPAFLASCVCLVGMVSSAAFGIHPFVLPAVTGPDRNRERSGPGYLGDRLDLHLTASFPASVRTSPVTIQEQPVGFGNIHFDFDKSFIRDDAKPILGRVAEYMKKNPDARLQIEGHCDERGTSEYNMALGERRASAASKYLQNLGVAGNRLSTISYGEEKPHDPGHTEEAWAKNRRAVFVVK